MKRLENGNTGYTRHTSKERYHCAPFLRPDGSSMIRPSASWQGRRSSAVDESVFSRTRELAIPRSEQTIDAFQLLPMV